ncbi:MAG: UDP-3-O-(3-hydroxymyristoyl)glucosamine N-acyltransferase [Bdellovibrionales bacterium]|nr:UDP-3-O-(3-hydroxymyristoyl)glucosamine N-acyltransferase [Bdellovibrionales bacterium]
MFTLDEVLQWSEGRVVNSGEGEFPQSGPTPSYRRLTTLKDASPEDVAFFFSKDYESELRVTRAGLIITGDAFVAPLRASGLPQWKTSRFIACADPYSAMAKVTREVSKTASTHDHQSAPAESRIHPSAILHPSAKIGSRVSIGAHVVIEAGVEIADRVTIYPNVFVGPSAKVGSDSVLFPNVVIYEKTVIGERCRLHAGAVIGADGFGYAPKVDPTTKLTVDHQKIYHLGRVVIGNDVEVGANSTIDRGTLGDTVIHSKVKIDNQVQVGHNVELCEGAILCGCSGVAGSSTVGKFSILGAQAGLGNKVNLGEYSILTAYAGAAKDFPPHSVLAGMPARPQSEQLRILAIQQKLLKERGKKK